MAQRMSGPLLRAWRAYEQVEPFGQDRRDLGVAQLSALVANRTRSKKEGAYKTEDFLFSTPHDREPDPKQRKDPAKLWASMKHMVKTVYGGQKPGAKPDGS